MIEQGYIIKDMQRLTRKYFVDGIISKQQLGFRIRLLKEEAQEAQDAFHFNNYEDIVDAHIDSIVIAVGTLLMLDVDIEKAWKEVFRANMKKILGVKPGREESNGFDLMKPDGWVSPQHHGNTGRIDGLYKK